MRKLTLFGILSLISIAAFAIDDLRLPEGRYYIKQVDGDRPSRYGAWPRYYLTVGRVDFKIQVAPDERKENPEQDFSSGRLITIKAISDGSPVFMYNGITDARSKGAVKNFVIGYQIPSAAKEYLTTLKPQKIKNFRRLHLVINGEVLRDYVVENYDPKTAAKHPPYIWK